MRTYRTGVAVLAALLVTLAVNGVASATTFGIQINEPQLVRQIGMLRFTIGAEVVMCNVTLTKTLITEQLIAVEPPPMLTKLGKVTSARLMPECPIAFLNLPPNLGGVPGPGPNPESWDISFLYSDLPEGQLHFGILDVQIVYDQFPEECLYRGTLLGVLTTDGQILRYAEALPLFMGVMCPPTVAVEGVFNNEPAINYVLLP